MNLSQETKILIGIGIATVLIIVGGAFFMGGNSSPDKPKPPSDAKVVVRPNSHKETAPNAKVTLVEFGDFQCPACGAAFPVVSRILEEYKGKINFVFRHYPLPMHQNAMIAAEAAEAAGTQGKFFEMYELLYSNQAEWGESKNPMDFFMKYAKDIKIDTDKFKKDVESKKYESRIKSDQSDGNILGVNATPTFFINNQMQSGGLPYDEFKTKIDAALNSK